ncbi:hypothetical protein JG688_00018642 [Phytophthora aleatoria]|uniref:Uncharacterized protein n=1 Tax=Phytophthora aleatoria TaxID=2496075 RepID=A0A8J5LXJ3_9STRA|nr:hypothetical protein JG688_00018642 [Phytophthora aleatoria]
MSMHAREMLFVLDVLKDDTVRMQGYAYKDIPLDADHTVETGTVQATPTDAGQLLIKDLVKEGTLPLMLVLRHLTSGNHYQAITYPKKKIGEYARNWKDLTSKRNAVIITFGGCSLDPIPYDAQKTAQAAAQQLKKMRSAAKLVRQSAKGGATVEEPREMADDAAGPSTDTKEAEIALPPFTTSESDLQPGGINSDNEPRRKHGRREVSVGISLKQERRRSQG